MNLTNREAINLFRMAMDPDLGDPYRNSPYLEGVPWPDLPNATDCCDLGPCRIPLSDEPD